MNRDKRIIIQPKCSFCTSKSMPNYKDALVMKRFVSDKGKIISASRTGVCSKHQRVLSRSIKQARTMALLPYTDKHTL